MLSIIITILLVVGLFKFTGFLLKIIGAVFGAILSIIGWLILAALAVTVFSLGMVVLPVILIAGAAAVISALAS